MATAIPSVSIPTQVKSCKVVLEDISLPCGAAKLQRPYRIKDKTHMTDSHHTTESNFLKNLCLKTPIAWGNSIDERWTELDDKVLNFICVLLCQKQCLFFKRQFILKLQAFFCISNKKQVALLDKAKELNFPFNLATRKTCF